MKKYLVLLVIFISVLFFMGCNEDGFETTKNGVGYDISYDIDYLNSEYYIFDHSEHIVKAKLIDISSWGGINVYEYKVEKEYYGELNGKIIHVYGEEDVRYKIGRRYYLFLIDNGKLSNGDTKYSMCSRHIFFPANKRVYEYGYEQRYVLNRSDIANMIEDAAATRNEREIADFNKFFVSKNSCIGDAAKEAEEVALITVDEKVFRSKKYIPSYHITTDEIIKGSINHIAPIMDYLGKLELGKQYILMLKYNESTLRCEIFDKKYSIVEATATNVADVMVALNK